MRFTLRFVLLLILVRAGIAYAIAPLVDQLTLRWFMKDHDIRSSLIVNTIRNSRQVSMKIKLVGLISLLLLHSQITHVYAENITVSNGQMLYLPIYSNILHGDIHAAKGRPMKAYLSALVSIRNTSPKTPIKIQSAQYFNTDGKLLKDFVTTPQTIAPMGTLELFVEKSETEGGSGAKFLIQWGAESAITPPLVEAVHIDNQAGRPYSFITRAYPVQSAK